MADLIDAFTGTSTVEHTVPDVYLSYGFGCRSAAATS